VVYINVIMSFIFSLFFCITPILNHCLCFRYKIIYYTNKKRINKIMMSQKDMTMLQTSFVFTSGRQIN